MRIAVISETSAGNKNADVLAALEGRGHEVINIGMTKTGGDPELTYIHTGLLAGLVLNCNKADLVVGGCGTGQGFLNSAMQYPGVFCGLMQNPSDAWLFAQINGGNCISLAFNFQYGWAGEVNLKFIFDRLFSFEQFGLGYPPHRQESQQASRRTLQYISTTTHKTMAEILKSLDNEIVQSALNYPGVLDFLDVETLEDSELRKVIKNRT